MGDGERFVLAVGSNIDPAVHLPAALGALLDRTELEVERLSSVYETDPVGAPGTPRFYNAALLVRTSLPAGRLKLEVLRPIEAALGRRRGADPNAPRPIDLDLVMRLAGPVDDPEHGLRLPDPQLSRQAHLAVPVSEVLNQVPHEWRDPESGLPLVAIAQDLAPQARRVDLGGWDLGGIGGVKAT